MSSDFKDRAKSMRRFESSVLAKASSIYVNALESNPEDMADDVLQETVDNLTQGNHFMALENEVIERYLKRIGQTSGGATVSPTGTVMSSLADSSIKVASRMRLDISTKSITTSKMSLAAMAFSRRGGALLPNDELPRMSYASVGMSQASSSRPVSNAPRVNLHYMGEIINSEVEEMNQSLGTMRGKAMKQHADLRAILEDMTISLAETTETLALFQETVASMPGRIPAEKFLRFMETWYKREDQKIGRMRLRTSTAMQTLARVGLQLQKKREIGENIHPVDFDQLRIENDKCLELIEEKNYQLLLLKNVTGRAGVKINTAKKMLVKQLKELSDINDLVASREEDVRATDALSVTVGQEVARAQVKYNRVKDKMSKFTVPDVIDYVRKVAELHKIESDMKEWSRRNQVIATTLRSAHIKLQTLRLRYGPVSKTDLLAFTSDSAEFEFPFERAARRSSEPSTAPPASALASPRASSAWVASNKT